MSDDFDGPPIGSATPTIAMRFFVEGHVQGVFFREWTVGKAREIGLSGWVRNLRDGRVEVYAIGEAALIKQFAEQLNQGSPASVVESVQSEEVDVEAINGFTRRQTS